MFVRKLKQNNKSGVAYKMAIAKSVRSSGKVRHKILLYIGTFAEKHRHDIERHRKFLNKISKKFAQIELKPYEKEKLRREIYDLLPEIYDTMVNDLDTQLKLRR